MSERSRRGAQKLACSEERRVLAWLPQFGRSENPYRARDAVTFFEPTPSERGPLQECRVHASLQQWRGSLKRLRGSHLVSQVQTGSSTRHNGRGSFFLLP